MGNPNLPVHTLLCSRATQRLPDTPVLPAAAMRVYQHVQYRLRERTVKVKAGEEFERKRKGRRVQREESTGAQMAQALQQGNDGRAGGAGTFARGHQLRDNMSRPRGALYIALPTHGARPQPGCRGTCTRLCPTGGRARARGRGGPAGVGRPTRAWRRGCDLGLCLFAPRGSSSKATPVGCNCNNAPVPLLCAPAGLLSSASGRASTISVFFGLRSEIFLECVFLGVVSEAD